jgi:hypothetical protein
LARVRIRRRGASAAASGQGERAARVKAARVRTAASVGRLSAVSLSRDSSMSRTVTAHCAEPAMKGAAAVSQQRAHPSKRGVRGSELGRPSSALALPTMPRVEMTGAREGLEGGGGESERRGRGVEGVGGKWQPMSVSHVLSAGALSVRLLSNVPADKRQPGARSTRPHVQNMMAGCESGKIAPMCQRGGGLRGRRGHRRR